MPRVRDRKQMTLDLDDAADRRVALRRAVLGAVAATSSYAAVAAATGMSRSNVACIVRRARDVDLEPAPVPAGMTPVDLARRAAARLAEPPVPVVRIVPPEPVFLASPTVRMARAMTAPPWTSGQSATLRARIAAGDDYATIARVVGRSVEAVRRRAKSMSVAVPSRRAPWTDAEDRRALVLRARGLTDAEVAARLDRSESSVSARLSRLHDAGVPVAPSPRNRYWLPEQEARLVDMHLRGATVAEIAAAMGKGAVAVEDGLTAAREDGRIPGFAHADEHEVGGVRRPRPGRDPLLAALHVAHGVH